MRSIPLVVLIFSFVNSSSVYSWTRSNLKNDKLYESADSRSPAGIQWVDLMVTAANVTTQPSPQLVHVVHINWTEAQNAASYRVRCEANTTNKVITLLDKIISDKLTELDEKFILPQGHHSLLCALKATNSFGTSKWTYSPAVTVHIIDMAAKKVVIKSAKTMEKVDVEKLALNQLLQLIHASHVENLPPLPLARNLERPAISRPNTKEVINNQRVDCLSRESTISINAKSLADLSSANEPVIESIAQFPEMDYNEDHETSKEVIDAYDTLEEDLRLAIGADKASQEARRKSLQLFGISDRVL